MQIIFELRLEVRKIFRIDDRDLVRISKKHEDVSK